MIDETTRQRVDRWLDGDPSVDDEVALRKVLEDHPEALSFLAHRALLHVHLSEAAHRPPPLDAGFERRRSRPRHRFWTIAAMLACGIFLTLALPRASAGPGDLVRKALGACRTPVDRRYAVQVEPARPHLREALGRPSPPRSTLWVRDARFVQSTEVQGRRLSWGRDAGGAVWFSLSPHSVAVFDADEIPDALRDVCDLRTLDLATLLESLLADFDLERIGGDGTTDTIVARPRDGTSRFGAVEIAIERDSLRVLHVLLERRLRGRVAARVRFSLEETAAREETIYEWRGHVEPDVEVLDRGAARGARRELLAELVRVVGRPTAAPAEPGTGGMP